MLRSQVQAKSRHAWMAGVGLFAALLAALCVFGARTHWVEEADTAERDAFVAQAEQVLAGETPRDPYRPPLYPYAIAALTPLAGDPFTAARLLANLSAAALALLAFGFGRRLAPEEHANSAGLWAFALVAANPNTWTFGQHATTDMPFAAFAAAALLAGLAYLRRPRWSSALAAGLAFGAAAATRDNAVLLAIGLLAAWWLARRTNVAARGGDQRDDQRDDDDAKRNRAVLQLVVTGVLVALILTPKWLLRARTFGDPFHSENWRNLAWKLDWAPDWSKLATIPPGGSFGRLLRERPLAIVRGAAVELADFAVSGTSHLLGTAAHVLACLAGAALCWRRRPRETAWLVGSVAVFVGGVALVFFTWGRFFLLLLPIAAGLLAAGLQAIPGSAASPRRKALASRGALALLVGVLAVKSAFFSLPEFVGHHPYDDVAALRKLEGTLPPDRALAGTSPFLDRYLHRPYFAIPDAFGAEVHDGAAYTKRLVETLRDRHVAYLVVGVVDLRARPRALLDGAPAPEGLALVERAARVTIWRVQAPEHPDPEDIFPTPGR